MGTNDRVGMAIAVRDSWLDCLLVDCLVDGGAGRCGWRGGSCHGVKIYYSISAAIFFHGFDNAAQEVLLAV